MEHLKMVMWKQVDGSGLYSIEIEVNGQRNTMVRDIKLHTAFELMGSRLISIKVANTTGRTDVKEYSNS